MSLNKESRIILEVMTDVWRSSMRENCRSRKYVDTWSQAATVMTRSSCPLLGRANVYRAVIAAQNCSGEPLSSRVPTKMKSLPKVEIQNSTMLGFFVFLEKVGFVKIC